MNEIVDSILKGSYDLHVHAGPDPNQNRRLDAIETARHAYEAEMGGFVLKSHEYLTSPLTYALEQMYPGLTVAGSISLNREVGGLNHQAVQTAARLGAKVIWMPTLSARSHFLSCTKTQGISLTDNSGKLHPELYDILNIVAESGMILASGHISISDTHALFDAAKKAGCEKLIVTHPSNSIDAADLQPLVEMGAYIEYTFVRCLPSGGGIDPRKLAADIRTQGVDNCIITTDLGQWMNPPPAEGMRMAIASLLVAEMSSEEISTLVKTNPATLLGIDA